MNGIHDDFAYSKENLIALIATTDTCINEYLEKRYEEYGLKGKLHIYVTVVARHPGIAQKELIASYFLLPSNVTRKLDYLVNEGFIRREKDPNDFRGWLLFPTEKTMAIYDDVVAIFDELHDSITSLMTEDHKRILIKSLCNIRERTVEMMPKKKKRK